MQGTATSPRRGFEEEFEEKLYGLLMKLSAFPPPLSDAEEFIRECKLPIRYTFLLTRDVALYDTLRYTVKAGFILSGGYGINAVFFDEFERRLSLADLDIISKDEMSPDYALEKLNRAVREANAVFTVELSQREKVSIGYFVLNEKKLKWLRRRNITSVIPLRRTVLLPVTYGRGMKLEDYLKQKLKTHREWYRIVKTLRSLKLSNLKVEDVEVDLAVIPEVEYFETEATPLLKKWHKRFKPLTVKAISPHYAVKYLSTALNSFIASNEPHNVTKTIIDLRVAKKVNLVENIKPLIERALRIPEVREEYESGREAWRFALLKRKYKTIDSLVHSWFNL